MLYACLDSFGRIHTHIGNINQCNRTLSWAQLQSLSSRSRILQSTNGYLGIHSEYRKLKRKSNAHVLLYSRHTRELTWHSKICKHSILSVLNTTHIVKENIYDEKSYTQQESHHTYTYAIAACSTIAHLTMVTVVPSRRYTSKHDYWKHLKNKCWLIILDILYHQFNRTTDCTFKVF